MDINYYKKYEPIFGSWHIVREIGEGSFGKVFEIEREDFGYTYKAALKAITIPQSQSEIKSALADGMNKETVTSYFRGCVEELVKEFAIMSELKGHSNIVSYEDHIVVQHNENIGWDILIRMELLTPLVDYIQMKTLDRNEVIKLGVDICKALEACQVSNIVHRDIKPENIFVSKRGDFKLGDFGIAKTVEKTTGGLSKKGTYTYMAPEIYKGEACGSSVDIYSLGIVLYRFMNNQRTPFLPAYPEIIKFNDKEMALSRRIGGEEIPAPANADKALADVILKACAYDPKDRYASPTEMRIALEKLDKGLEDSVPATENEEKNTLIVETANNTEKENVLERTVSLFGAVEKKEAINNSTEPDVSQERGEETDKTISVLSTGSTRPDLTKNENEQDCLKYYKKNYATDVKTTKRIEARRTQNSDGKWKIENVYDVNDLLMTKIEYTSLGNRFKATFYDENGKIEKMELYDYSNRIRKRMFYNGNGVAEKCFNYEYKQGKCIETEE